MATVPKDLADGLLRDWGWAGFPGGMAHDMNPFGAVLCHDIEGHVWVLSPADLDAYVISDLPNQLDVLWGDPVFQDNWQRRADVAEVETRLGPLGVGEIYALRVPKGLRGPGEPEAYDRVDAITYTQRMANLARRLHEAGAGCEVQIDSDDDGSPPRFTIIASQ